MKKGKKIPIMKTCDGIVRMYVYGLYHYTWIYTWKVSRIGIEQTI